MFPRGRDHRYSLIWIDKAGLSLAAAVLVMFLLLWLLLILAAGSAPTARLSLFCLEWATKTVLEAVVPVWLIARGIHAMAPRTFPMAPPRNAASGRPAILLSQRSSAPAVTTGRHRSIKPLDLID